MKTAADQRRNEDRPRGSPERRRQSNGCSLLTLISCDGFRESRRAKAQHIIELRQAVDALRAMAGLGPAPWTDPTLSPFATTIRAVHILELRSFLEDAASRLGYPPGPAYTDPGLTLGFVIKRAHIEDLRQRIRTIAG